LHTEYFLYAAKNKKHFFVEAGTDTVGYDELIPMLDDSFVAAPSCTFRYFPAVRQLKKFLEEGVIGKPLCFTHYLGQYLPDWHPYEDYRKVYFSQKGTGGCREMFPYELIWLSDIFKSSVKKVQGIRGKISDLEMTADDIYISTVQFENGVVGSMLIDILNRKAGRFLNIIGEDGTLEWDWLGKTISIFTQGEEKKVIDLSPGKKIAKYNTGEESYEVEVADFIDAIVGNLTFPYAFKEDEYILNTLDSFQSLV